MKGSPCLTRPGVRAYRYWNELVWEWVAEEQATGFGHGLETWQSSWGFADGPVTPGTVLQVSTALHQPGVGAGLQLTKRWVPKIISGWGNGWRSIPSSPACPSRHQHLLLVWMNWVLVMLLVISGAALPLTVFHFQVSHLFLFHSVFKLASPQVSWWSHQEVMANLHFAGC